MLKKFNRKRFLEGCRVETAVIGVKHGDPEAVSLPKVRAATI